MTIKLAILVVGLIGARGVLSKNTPTLNTKRMINAIPNHQQPETSSTPAGTPPTPAVSPVISQPSPNPVSATTPAAPHGQAGDFSADLSRKVGKDTPTPSSPIISTPNGSDSSTTTSSPREEKHSVRNTLVAVLVLTLAIAGGGAGYFLSQQNQDVRQQAASEEVIQTEVARSESEWQLFAQGWNRMLADSTKTWEEYVEYALTEEGARYSCAEPVMTVADETLYGCDLNALFVLYEPQTYAQAGSLSAQNPELNRVLDGLITNSGILQEAEKMGFLSLSSNTYNSMNKNHIDRITTVKQVRDQFGSQFDKTVDFEAVVIYFYNQIAPTIPVAEAQAAAKAKMDILYERLQSGEITMLEAAEEIRRDSIVGDTTGVSLANLDRLYRENAYVNQIAHRFDSRFFKDESLDEELRSLGEGQMSTVRTCKDYQFTDEELLSSISGENNFNPPLADSCYIIFKVNKINFGIIAEGSEQARAEDFIGEEYARVTTNHMNTP